MDGQASLDCSWRGMCIGSALDPGIKQELYFSVLMKLPRRIREIGAWLDKDAGENPWRWRGLGITALLVLDFLVRG